MMLKNMVLASMFATVAIYTPVSAQENTCQLSKISAKSDSQSDTDGGTRANASVTAIVEASNGFFIWGPSVKYTNNGSRSPRAPSATVTPHPVVANAPILHTLILKQATYTATCYDIGRLGDASCTATAFIVGTQFPIECLDALTRGSLEDALANISESQ